ncbi:MAG: winged helix-turn-helix transcriptional regulator [Crenarchaeota archaeon]|nr:winged helix-turn-helix transcriptional regulator [Thermoproteota archaeon]
MGSKEKICEFDSVFLLSSSRGSNSRMKILELLLFGSKGCNQIAFELKLNWRTVSRHLRFLEAGVLVKSFPFGQRKIYRLTSKGEEVIEYLIKHKPVLHDIKKDRCL